MLAVAGSPVGADAAGAVAKAAGEVVAAVGVADCQRLLVACCMLLAFAGVPVASAAAAAAAVVGDPGVPEPDVATGTELPTTDPLAVVQRLVACVGRRMAGRLADTTSAGEVASAVRRPGTDRLRVRTRRSGGRRIVDGRVVGTVLLVVGADGWFTQGRTETLDGRLNGLVTVVGQRSVTIVAVDG